ncbi:MAG: ribonuclease HII [Candidatus Cloacimonetes bacterium]|nr:ribonuclease HII [Candidatus Cloacimonadota bacterium]
MSSYTLIAGLDEVGRGPLAGPVVVAAALLDQRSLPEGLKDSKLLNAKTIESFSAVLKEVLPGYKIVAREPSEIDRLNIYQATKQAMLEALEGLPTKPQAAISDALPLPEASIPVYALVKADQTQECVMAASILAKMYRDSLMIAYDSLYPQYGFASHMGYPTARHLEALKQYGITPIHRLSYQPVLEALLFHREHLESWIQTATGIQRLNLLNRALKIKKPSSIFCEHRFLGSVLLLKKAVGL